jgi:histidinol phosphatase-like enzyme
MVICFDLDGTICDTDDNLPVPEKYYRCNIKPVMRDVVKRFYDKGHTVIIDTARGSSATGLTKYYTRWKLKRHTRSQLKQWNVPFHQLRVGIKTPADMYIDDRALTPHIFEKK